MIAQSDHKSGRQTSIVATNDSTKAKPTSFTYDYTKAGEDTALRQSVTDLSGTSALGVSSATAAAGPATAVTSNSVDPAPGTTDLYTRDNTGSLMGLLFGGLAGIAVAGLLVSGFGAPVIVGGIVGGCVGGIVGSAVSQHGKVSPGGAALNCFTGAAIGAVGGVFAKGGFRGGS